ncbi:MAG TPA: hypothetical protein VNT75_24760 [Symbiobacteriaceae bacterium]|nr:hypothetical protein [Symbiobacteriaceae bacterium]
MLRSFNPRLNPLLRPDQWESMARLNRLRLAAVFAAVVSVLLGVSAYYWFPIDRTRDMAPEAVVERAGLALLQAGQYRFHMELSGQSQEYAFPGADMTGQYQRSPAVIHLAGTVDSGESRIPLEYYLEEKNLYMLHPITKDWLFLKDAPLDELLSFLPENLAAPLLGGVRGVEEVGRERLEGGAAVRYRLELAPEVMLPRQPELRQDDVEYSLWVYARTLEPARFSMRVLRQVPEEGKNVTLAGDRFTYQLTWQFRGLAPLAVPETIKTSAQDVGGETAPVQP